MVSANIAWAITATSAPAAIGSPGRAYRVGVRRLFVVDRGTDMAVYQFMASDADAAVEAAELSLLATLQGSTGVSTGIRSSGRERRVTLRT